MSEKKSGCEYYKMFCCGRDVLGVIGKECDYYEPFRPGANVMLAACRFWVQHENRCMNIDAQALATEGEYA